MNQHAQTVEIEVYDKRQRRAATIGTSDVENLFPIIDNGLGGFSIVDDRGVTLKDGLTTYEKALYERRLLHENKAVAAA